VEYYFQNLSLSKSFMYFKVIMIEATASLINGDKTVEKFDTGLYFCYEQIISLTK